MNDIPAPYDHTSGSRTLTQAMKELQEFRLNHPRQDSSFLKRTYPTENYFAHDEVEEVKPPKRNKRKAE